MSLLRTIGLLLISIAGVLGLLVMLLAILMPDTVTGLRLGGELFTSTVTEQTGSLVQAIKLNPLVDAAILLGAYVFVCLISWSQDQLANYLANRRHYS